MTMLSQMVAKQRELGARQGESAKQWAARDPQAARRFAEWLHDHKSGVIAEMVQRVTR